MGKEARPPPSWVFRFIKQLQTYSLHVQIVWVALLLAAIGFCSSKRWSLNGTESIEVVTGESAAVHALMNDTYPILTSGAPLVALLHRKNGSSILGPDVKDWSDQFAAFLLSHPDVIVPNSVFGYYPLKESGKNEIVCMAFVNGSYSIFSAVFSLQNGIKVPNDVSKDAVKAANDIAKVTFPNGEVSVQLTGELFLSISASDAINTALLHVVSAAVPLLLLASMIMLRSVRLVVLLITVVVTEVILTLFFVMLIAQDKEVGIFTMNALIITSAAFGMAHGTLFLFNFRDNIDRQREPAEAVNYALFATASGLLISGASFDTFFALLATCTFVFLASLGWSCSIAFAVVIVCTMVFAPAPILFRPDFFSQCTKPWPCLTESRRGSMLLNLCLCMCFPRQQQAVDDVLPAERNGGVHDRPLEEARPLLDRSVNPSQRAQETPLTQASRLLTWRLTKVLQKLQDRRVALVIVILFFGLTMGLGYKAITMQTTISLSVLTSRADGVIQGFWDTITYFDSSSVFPYQLFFAPPPGVPVLSNTSFELANIALSALRQNAPPGVKANFVGLPNVLGYAVQYEEIADCILSVNPPVCDQVPAKCIPVCFLLPMFVGEQAQSLAVQIGLNVDPFEPDGKKWYENALDALGGVRAQHSSATFVLTAGASWRYDYVNDMYERLPWIVVATILVVVVFTGIVFSSIVIPVLLVCSMVVSIGPTLGAAVLYFASQPVGAMSWVIPVLTMPLLLGAVLDPDVQLLLKVVSFRSNNVPTRDSIACAVVSLFRVWFGNALFMTVMMVIWLFSEVEVIQMLAATLGTVFVWATLAVRPFFLPALLSLAGDWVWWPHMPPVVPTSPAEFSQHGAI